MNPHQMLSAIRRLDKALSGAGKSILDARPDDFNAAAATCRSDYGLEGSYRVGRQLQKRSPAFSTITASSRGLSSGPAPSGRPTNFDRIGSRARADARQANSLGTRACRARRGVPPRRASNGCDCRFRVRPSPGDAQPHLRAAPARRLRLRGGGRRERQAALRPALVSVEGRGARDALDPERVRAAGKGRAEAHPRLHRARPRACAQVHGRRGHPPGRRPGRSSRPRRLHQHEDPRHGHRSEGPCIATLRRNGFDVRAGHGNTAGRQAHNERQALSPRADRGRLSGGAPGGVPAGRSQIRPRIRPRAARAHR